MKKNTKKRTPKKKFKTKRKMGSRSPKQKFKMQKKTKRRFPKLFKNVPGYYKVYSKLQSERTFKNLNPLSDGFVKDPNKNVLNLDLK